MLWFAEYVWMMLGVRYGIETSSRSSVVIRALITGSLFVRDSLIMRRVIGYG